MVSDIGGGTRRAARGLGRLAALIAPLALAFGAQAETLQDVCGDCRLEKVVTCGEFLEGVNFDRDSVMWAVSLFNGDILRIADGRCVVAAKTGGHPNGARFHKDGRLFITDNVRGVLIFDTHSGALSVFADKIDGQPMVGANDLAFDQAGGLYVTVPGASNYLDRSGRLIYFPPGSSTAKVVASGLPYPNGVAIWPDGLSVDVGLYGAKTIITLPAEQNPSKRRGPYVHVLTQGGIGPDGMGFDAKGRLYWADFLGGAVGVADDAGFPLGYIKLPANAGRWTTNLAFRGDYLYVTEANKGEIWRVRVAAEGANLFGPP